MQGTSVLLILKNWSINGMEKTGLAFPTSEQLLRKKVGGR